MSQTKFTPGEWEIKEQSVGGMCSVNTGHFKIDTKDIHSFITIECETKEESKAVAVLLKAAPDMYAMVASLARELQMAIEEVNLYRMKEVTQQAETQPDMWDMESLHDAQLLLKKARGE